MLRFSNIAEQKSLQPIIILWNNLVFKYPVGVIVLAKSVKPIKELRKSGSSLFFQCRYVENPVCEYPQKNCYRKANHGTY